MMVPGLQAFPAGRAWGECFSRLRIRFVQLHLGAQAAGDRLTGRKRKGSRQASGLQFFSSQRGRVLRNQSVRRAEIYIALPGNCTGRHWRKLAPARTASTICMMEEAVWQLPSRKVQPWTRLSTRLPSLRKRTCLLATLKRVQER